jgi:uncharacterized membrane protein
VDSHLQHPGPDLAVPDAAADKREWMAWSSALPHDCEPEPERAPTRVERRPGRLTGLDAARGVALIGMLLVHIVDPAAADGEPSLPWLIASGTSSALFAVLGGIGIAFMTGRHRAPKGRQWASGAWRLLVRGLVIILLGLALGHFVPVDDAALILPSLGIMFWAVIPLIRLNARPLLILAGCWALAAPVVSQWLRWGTALPSPTNWDFVSVAMDPLGFLASVTLTGGFPALTWFAYILLGLGLGRLGLQARSQTLKIVGVGVVLAWGATRLSAALLGTAGGTDRLATDTSESMRLVQLSDILVWGGDGTVPANSWTWLAVAAPHTGVPLDLLRTGGVALAVIGIFLAVAAVFPGVLRLLVAPGSMTLTLYAAHVLMLGTPIDDLPEWAAFAVHVAVLTAFALVWRRWFTRGPLESVLARLTRGPKRKKAELPDQGLPAGWGRTGRTSGEMVGMGRST